MTTATLAAGNRTMDNAVRPRRSLEELVDRLMAAMFPEQPQTAPATETPSVTKSVHEARRMRQAGDIDTALAVLAGMDVAKAERHEARWAFSEWKQMVRRRFGDRGVLVYSQGRDGPPPWCPTATAGRLRSLRSWGCAGSRASWSRGAACGVCGL